QEAECPGAGQWKRSARGADGFFVQLEPDSGACEAYPLESSRPEFAPAEFEREKPVFTVISPSELRVFGRARLSECEDLGCGLLTCGRRRRFEWPGWLRPCRLPAERVGNARSPAPCLFRQKRSTPLGSKGKCNSQPNWN